MSVQVLWALDRLLVRKSPVSPVVAAPSPARLTVFERSDAVLVSFVVCNIFFGEALLINKPGEFLGVIVFVGPRQWA